VIVKKPVKKGPTSRVSWKSATSPELIWEGNRILDRGFSFPPNSVKFPYIGFSYYHCVNCRMRSRNQTRCCIGSWGGCGIDSLGRPVSEWHLMSREWSPRTGRAPPEGC
jgi:hypothetical protein